MSTATSTATSTARPTGTTHELVRFLLSRFDEDDVELKRCARPGAMTALPFPVERLRTEALARRRILGALQQLLVLRDQPSEKPVRDNAVQALRSLAAPYSAHPGFRAEWKTSPRA